MHRDSLVIRNGKHKSLLVIVDPSVGKTGAFVCAQNMAIALEEYLPSLLVVPLNALHGIEELRPFKDCKYLRLRFDSRILPASLSWLLALIPSSLHLRWLLAQNKATHLVLNDFYLLQGVICRLLGFRGQIITWVRVEPKRVGGRFTILLWSLIALSSNRVVAVSCSVQQHIPAWLKPIVLYDCLVSDPKLQANPALFGRLVYLGHLMPGKGQDHAIEAFAAIAARFPQALLEFHGGTLGVASNKEWQQHLQQRCTSLGLEQRISFHGPYDDPFVPLIGADIALNFSDSETFSFTVLEALTAGVPVIATNSGGPSELINDQKTGVLVPVGDHAAMAQAMAERLNNLEQTAAMGKAAARSTMQRFSFYAYRLHLLALLDL